MCDTFSMSAANADGSTVAAVITQALTEADAKPEDVTAIKVHGTASLLNDESEAAGLLQIFSTLPPVFALKPFIGHPLGACGLTELILSWRSLTQADGHLPATPGIGADAKVLGTALNQSPFVIPAWFTFL